jgi:hypothetical protein
MAAGDADVIVRWDFCRLDFFVSFLVKQKRKEKKLYLRVPSHFRGNFHPFWINEYRLVG